MHPGFFAIRCHNTNNVSTTQFFSVTYTTLPASSLSLRAWLCRSSSIILLCFIDFMQNVPCVSEDKKKRIVTTRVR
jgi:hypothetical protein